MKIPDLAPGEQYAGIVLNAKGRPTHHLILLPDQPEARLTWNEAMEWAHAELPTRQEQALLYANLKHAFDPDWYWSSEQYSGSYAWTQSFYNGHQLTTGERYRGRVRAIRRVIIQEN